MTIRPVQVWWAAWDRTQNPRIKEPSIRCRPISARPILVGLMRFAYRILPAATGLFRDLRSHFAPSTLATGQVAEMNDEAGHPRTCSYRTTGCQAPAR